MHFLISLKYSSTPGLDFRHVIIQIVCKNDCRLTFLFHFSVENLARRFPNIMEETQLDTLVEEFQDYQLANKEELPDFENTDIDIFWSKMTDVELAFGTSKRFPTLTRLAKACLVLPVSNADVERIFSMLKKIQTEFRSELANDTICSLISCKQNADVQCFNFDPSDSVLKNAKSATKVYNK